MPSGLKNYEIPFNLNEEESRYWLGYICADGNISYNTERRNYMVSLFSKDKEIIDKFLKFVGSRGKYHLRKQNGIHCGYVCSKQLCDYMIELGIKPNKGLSLDIQFEIDKDFLRGLFDGDGSIRKNKNECKITSGSSIMVSKIEDYLDSLGIYYKTRTKGNAFDICIERKLHFLKFINHIYQDSIIYLDRKYKQFDALGSNS